MRILITTLCLSSLIAAQTPDAAAASDRRNSAAKAYEEGRFDDAIQGYRDALAIYEQLGAEWHDDCAVLRRAIVWNLVEAGRTAVALTELRSFAGELQGDARLFDEVAFAARALHRAARSRSDHAQQDRLFREVRDLLIDERSPALAASTIREAGGNAWNQGRYADAITFYQEALGIYEAAPGDWVPERATTLRAIVWNAARLEQLDTALDRLEQLSREARGRGDLEHELESAYLALFELATRSATLEEKSEPCRAAERIFKSHGWPRLAARTLQHRAEFAGDAGQPQQMVTLFYKAIAGYDRADDSDGEAWCHNGLAHHALRAQQLREARPALTAAFRLVSRGEATAVQPSLTTNLQAALDLVDSSKPSQNDAAWLWEMAEEAARSEVPRTLPPNQLIRAAMEADVARSGGVGAIRGTRRALQMEIAGDCSDMRSDIAITAAELLLETGRTKDALRILEGITIGEGPVGVHLNARLQLALACAAGATGDVAAYDRHADAAIAAFDAMGNHTDRLANLRRLEHAGRELNRSLQYAAVAKAYEALRQTGAPGGDGGTATVQAMAELPDDLGDHDPLFAIRFAGGVIEVEDLLGGSRWQHDVRWKVRHASQNGLSLSLFGGYIKIRSLSYSPVSVARGADGTPANATGTTLEQLGSYLPVPADGTILVTRNGSWRYELN